MVYVRGSGGRGATASFAMPLANGAAAAGGGIAFAPPPPPLKVFVGGLSQSVTDDEFRAYFEQFGVVTDAVVMFDRQTQRSRGFGFATFLAEVRGRLCACVN